MSLISHRTGAKDVYTESEGTQETIVICNTALVTTHPVISSDDCDFFSKLSQNWRWN